MSATITFSIAGKDGNKLKERIQQEAITRGLSMSEFVTEAVAEHLRRLSNAA